MKLTHHQVMTNAILLRKFLRKKPKEDRKRLIGLVREMKESGVFRMGIKRKAQVVKIIGEY